jgi:hypothetical protein
MWVQKQQCLLVKMMMFETSKNVSKAFCAEINFQILIELRKQGENYAHT